MEYLPGQSRPRVRRSTETFDDRGNSAGQIHAVRGASAAGACWSPLTILGQQPHGALELAWDHVVCKTGDWGGGLGGGGYFLRASFSAS